MQCNLKFAQAFFSFRYYLLVFSPNNFVDMAKLRKVSVSMVWALYLFCVLVFHIAVLLLNNGQFVMTPGGIFWSLAPHEQFTYFVTRGVIFEVPDWLSILVLSSSSAPFQKDFSSTCTSSPRGY